MIAHRGARLLAPENTMPAFEKALSIGADGIELDVNITLDGEVVVAHNDDLNQLTGFRGNIHKETLSTLSRLDAGSHHSKEFAGTKIPTLSEALEFMSVKSPLTIVEIKKQRIDPRISAERTLSVISRFNFRGAIVVSSASLQILRAARRINPRIRLASILVARPFSFFVTTAYAKLAKVSAIHAATFALSRALAFQTRALRMDLFAWTANTQEQIDRCLELQVDGIISDDILRLREHIASRGL